MILCNCSFEIGHHARCITFRPLIAIRLSHPSRRISSSASEILSAFNIRFSRWYALRALTRFLILSVESRGSLAISRLSRCGMQKSSSASSCLLVFGAIFRQRYHAGSGSERDLPFVTSLSLLTWRRVIFDFFVLFRDPLPSNGRCSVEPNGLPVISSSPSGTSRKVRLILLSHFKTAVDGEPRP